MRARFMGFFPRLNPLALVPLGLGPKNLAKHNFKSTMSQLAELNFLELRVQLQKCKHMQTTGQNKETLKNTQVNMGQNFLA
jgi:hypothetical protein